MYYILTLCLNNFTETKKNDIDIQRCALIPGKIIQKTKVIELAKLVATANSLEDLLESIRSIQNSTKSSFMLHHNLIRTLLTQTMKDFADTIDPICRIKDSEHLPLTKTIKEGILEKRLIKLSKGSTKVRRTLFNYKRRVSRDTSWILPGITPRDTRNPLVSQLTSVIQNLQKEIKGNSALLDELDHTILFISAALIAQNEAKLLNREIEDIFSQNGDLLPYLAEELEEISKQFTHSAFRLNSMEEKNKLLRSIYNNAQIEIETRSTTTNETKPHDDNLCNQMQIRIAVRVATPLPDSACFKHIKENKFFSSTNNLYAYSNQRSTTAYKLSGQKEVLILDTKATVITSLAISLVWTGEARWLTTEIPAPITLTCIDSSGNRREAKILQGTIIQTSNCDKILSSQLSFQAVGLQYLGEHEDELLMSANRDISKFTESYMEKKLKFLSNTTSIDDSIRSHLKQAARIEDGLRQRVREVEENSWLTTVTNRLKVIFIATVGTMATLLVAYIALSLACRCRKLKTKSREEREREQSHQKIRELETNVGSLATYLEMDTMKANQKIKEEKSQN